MNNYSSKNNIGHGLCSSFKRPFCFKSVYVCVYVNEYHLCVGSAEARRGRRIGGTRGEVHRFVTKYPWGN